MVTVKASSPQLWHLLSSEMKKTQTTNHVKAMRKPVFHKMYILIQVYLNASAFSLVSKFSAVFHFHLCRLVISQVPVRERSSSTFTSPMPHRTSCSHRKLPFWKGKYYVNSILKWRNSRPSSYSTMTLICRNESCIFIDTFKFMVTGSESSGSSPSSKRCMILNRTRS